MTTRSVGKWFWIPVWAAVTLRAQVPVRVTADNVNLRARPQLTAEVVTQAHYDDRLTAYELGDEWVEVAAPPSADLWVMKSYVRQPDNTVAANRVNVRAGPSINYNIVATLSRGEKIEPRGEELQEWMKIAPPPAARLWVHRDYVEPVAEVAAAAAPASVPAPEAAEEAPRRKSAPAAATPPAESTPGLVVYPSVPEKESRPREIPRPPPASLKLIPLEGQGRTAEFEGELRAAPLINEAPARYRLVRWQNNRWQILCHVYGETAALRPLQDKRVRVRGREYWIQGAAAPVVVPDYIQEIPAP